MVQFEPPLQVSTLDVQFVPVRVKPATQPVHWVALEEEHTEQGYTHLKMQM